MNGDRPLLVNPDVLVAVEVLLLYGQRVHGMPSELDVRQLPPPKTPGRSAKLGIAGRVVRLADSG
jgi:hypothetical protein